jgi:hypothetical protein
VERQGEGIPGRDGLLHQIKQPQENFRVAIRRTAPCFVPQYRDRPAVEPEPPRLMAALSALSSPSTTSASAASARSTSASATSTSATSVLQAVGKHTRPPFLKGEEDSEEIGLNDGKGVFIDDVLEAAEWCVP